MSEHASRPSAKPMVAPTPEQAAQMAANMLRSVVGQKHAIAQSFEAQRDAVLQAVNERKAAALQATPTPEATRTAPNSGATEAVAEKRAAAPAPEPGGEDPEEPSQGATQPHAFGPDGGETRDHAFPGVDSEVLKTLLSLADPRTAAALEQSLVMGQIVRCLRQLIAREVRDQLTAADFPVAQTTNRPAGQ